jgi:HAD superfamily hydrolase (TIGR01509 family)
VPHRTARRGAPPAGVVFDCDGTLADTESLSFRAWAATLADRGYRMTDQDFAAVVGSTFPRTWAYFQQRVDLGDADELRAQVRRRFLDGFTDLEVHDDAVGTMRQLVDDGVAIAVASSSTHASVLRVLETAGARDLVEVVIGAEDVQRHKPAPEPYLTAAQRLGVDPARCSAVEDTEVGVASAIAAGMFTVGILRAHNDTSTLSAAHRVVDTITVEALIAGADAVGR